VNNGTSGIIEPITSAVGTKGRRVTGRRIIGSTAAM